MSNNILVSVMLRMSDTFESLIQITLYNYNSDINLKRQVTPNGK